MAKVPVRKPVIAFLRAYHFGPNSKDPIIDRIHTLMEDTGMTPERIEQNGGAKAATVKAWIDGDTRSPMFKTVAATLRAMGIDFGDLVAVRKRLKSEKDIWAASAPRAYLAPRPITRRIAASKEREANAYQ